MKKKHFKFSTSHIIMFSFFLAITLGSLLLALPISSASGRAVPYIDALFTATTATCVTGLVTVPTVSTWSIFGQAVILILIQIGGLGIITIMSWLMITLHKKLSIGDRLLIQDAFNLNSLSGLAKFVKRVINGTFLIEAIGAFLYMTVFIPEFGILRGIWISVFNSVSAFCNAGIDIISETSLCNYATNPIINTVTSLLIIFGGIGYVVWWDVLRVIKNRPKHGLKLFKHLTLQSRIAILFSLLLIALGGIFIFIFEYNNPLTLKDYSIFDKIQMSLFQSVTTRTAGFASIPQENLSNPSAVINIVLMFIGGSPIGTAGGIKTVTVAVLIATAVSTVKNREEITLLGRSISRQSVNKAVAVFSMSFLIMLVSTVLLSAVTDAPALDILYETVSATATVGLSRNLTSSINFIGKIIIIATMYLGRVGPISLAIAFNLKKSSQNIIKNPTEEISIG